MSRTAEISLEFGGEERTFRLGIGQIVKVQEKCDAGPTGVAARCLVTLFILDAMRRKDYAALLTLDAKSAAEKPEVREVILQGLLGANMPAPEALGLVREWVDERPLVESLDIAYSICMASVSGTEDEKPAGEPLAANAASQNSPEESSASVKTGSTRSGRRSASRPATSTP